MKTGAESSQQVEAKSHTPFLHTKQWRPPRVFKKESTRPARALRLSAFDGLSRRTVPLKHLLSLFSVLSKYETGFSTYSSQFFGLLSSSIDIWLKIKNATKSFGTNALILFTKSLTKTITYFALTKFFTEVFARK